MEEVTISNHHPLQQLISLISSMMGPGSSGAAERVQDWPGHLKRQIDNYWSDENSEIARL